MSEISADRSVDRGGVFRHSPRFKRLCLDVTAEDVPRFGLVEAAGTGARCHR
ncbi:hypothetical protein [Streptomyces sp. NPDC001903]|uniref:hypothetical protein n=1 Tax=Streptomyces sp. NPDC001903 TaxID=3364622 RepID=UPI00368FA626